MPDKDKIDIEALNDLKELPFEELEKIKVDKPRTYEIAKARHKTTFWKKVRATIAGETTFGVVLGEVKNIAKHFIPYGHKIDALTDTIANKAKSKDMELLKRTFGKGGGGMLRVRNEDGDVDMTTILASVIRVALILGILWGANQIGLLAEAKALIGM